MQGKVDVKRYRHFFLEVLDFFSQYFPIGTVYYFGIKIQNDTLFAMHQFVASTNMSQKLRKDSPRKRPRAPPTSARKEVKG